LFSSGDQNVARTFSLATSPTVGQHAKKIKEHLKDAEITIRNLYNNMTDKLTGLCFNTHSAKDDKRTISLASHFLKFLCQPTFSTFAKPHKPTHNPSFINEPKFAHALNRIITFKEYNYER